jgi:hypothetical protein
MSTFAIDVGKRPTFVIWSSSPTLPVIATRIADGGYFTRGATLVEMIDSTPTGGYYYRVTGSIPILPLEQLQFFIEGATPSHVVFTTTESTVGGAQQVAAIVTELKGFMQLSGSVSRNDSIERNIGISASRAPSTPRPFSYQADDRPNYNTRRK